VAVGVRVVGGDDEFTVGLDDQGRVRISPTDVSQFIRLDRMKCFEELLPAIGSAQT
jgi:hypothetical protein